MSRRDDLIALRDAAQAGEAFHLDAPQRKVRAAEYPCLGGYYEDSMAYGAFHGSVDAALLFLAAVLPGWFWTRQGFVMTVTDDHTGWGSKPHFSARDDQNPARALLLATLSALIAETDT